ncbi:MAG: hypothetical protein BBJ57_07520 [Desulfobacterales bacterium PC51MH44]|nr:MAG: hypothetical protein BBJ57_07520 [Desulfobacterales bacterium PC51MH44]
MPKNKKSDIDALTEEGWELQPTEYVISAIEGLGKNVEKHSTEVRTAGEGVEKAMAGLSKSVVTALENATKKDNSDKATKQIAEIIKLSLDIFDKKQAGLVNKITVSNAELKAQAKAVVDAINKPKTLKFTVERNSIGLISEITALETK